MRCDVMDFIWAGGLIDWAGDGDARMGLDWNVWRAGLVRRSRLSSILIPPLHIR